MCNDEPLGEDSYTLLTEGFEIALNPQFISGLEVGSHQLKVKTSEGYAAVTVKVIPVEAAAPTPAPQSKPNVQMKYTLPVVMGILTSAAVAIWIKFRRKNY